MHLSREIMSAVVCESLERRTLSSSDPVIELAPSAAALASIEVASPQSSATKLSVFAWHPSSSATSFSTLLGTSVELDPISEAHRIAPLLQARESGQRGLMIWGVLYSQYHAWDLQNPAAVIADGLDPTHDRAWSESFFAELKALDAPLERVSMDVEAGFNTWSILPGIGDDAVAIMQNIYDDPDAYARLPETVRQFCPEDFRSFFTIAGRAAYNAWNSWSAAVVNLALRNAIFEPAQQYYGDAILVSNYGESAPRGQLLDRNGWPMAGPDRPTAGNISSPELYISNGAQFSSRNKDWRWNRLIDALNVVRNCIHESADSVTPWISYPSYRGDTSPAAKSTWLWEQLVRHLAASGISSLYYFNPGGATTTADDAFADRLFKALSPAATIINCTEPILYDADEITSGDFTTTYEDFLKFVDLPGATNLPPPPPTSVKPQVVSARLSSRSLIITGTAHADSIQLKQAGGNVVVFANGNKIGSFSSVKSLVIDAGKGADSVKLTFDTLLIPATISGGAGNDTLRGSAANDKLYGNAGDDNLFGGAGHDTLNGNEGANTLNGSTGNDMLWISPTLDLLTPSSGTDTIRRIGDDVLRQ